MRTILHLVTLTLALSNALVLTRKQSPETESLKRKIEIRSKYATLWYNTVEVENGLNIGNSCAKASHKKRSNNQ